MGSCSVGRTTSAGHRRSDLSWHAANSAIAINPPSDLGAGIERRESRGTTLTTLKDVIRSDKANVDTGKWARGHIPRAAFPMSKLRDKKYRYGQDYAWRLVKFEAAGHLCRILIWLNEEKQILRSRLGIERHGDMVVLCDYEFHAAEPGWHCHVAREHESELPAGVARHDKKKWPKDSSRKEFNVDEASALSIVATHYRFQAQGELI